jgi:adenosine deaminase
MSNLKLRVYDRMENSHVKRFLERGIKVTINSDDPAYFGGYVLDNYLAVARALDITPGDLALMARNSLEATFLPEPDKRELLAEFDAYLATHESEVSA